MQLIDPYGGQNITGSFKFSDSNDEKDFKSQTFPRSPTSANPANFFESLLRRDRGDQLEQVSMNLSNDFLQGSNEGYQFLEEVKMQRSYSKTSDQLPLGE